MVSAKLTPSRDRRAARSGETGRLFSRGEEIPLMNKLLYGVLLVLGLFGGLWVAQDNPGQVSVTLLGFPVGAQSLGVWLLLAFFLGVIIGLLATLPLLWRLRRAVRRQPLVPPSG